jgi:hypothetical protein
VRAVLVVVVDILAEHGFEVTSTEESMRSRHSRRMVPTRRSAMAFARGARTGVLMTLMPSAAKTTSKDLANLVSRSRMRNLTAASWSASSMEMFRACWVTQSVAGSAVTPAIWISQLSWWMKKST